MSKAATADTLTGTRLILAVGLLSVVAFDNLNWAAILITLTWIAGFLDGRVMRPSPHPTRMGNWDLRADTTVGIGLLIGLGIPHHAPWTVILAVMATAAAALIGHPSPAVLTLGFTYIWLIWLLYAQRPPDWWLPLLAAAIIGVAHANRLVVRSRMRHRFLAMEADVRVADRDRAMALLSRFGSNPLAFLIRYEASWQHFFGRRVEGVVCWVRHRGYAVV